MGLIRKNPFQTENNQPLYTLGLQKTVLLVGLGNVGKQYVGTRHNIGFVGVDAFHYAQGLSDWIEKKDLKCYLATGNVGNTRVIAIKPTTMMNLSGEAVQATAHFYKIQPNDIVAIHDELDIDFGQIRCRMGGGAAGHNGIKSLIKHMGEDFGRVRIGIGPKRPEQMDGADFVLAKFTADENEQMKPLRREVTALLTEYVASNQLPNDTRSFID